MGLGYKLVTMKWIPLILLGSLSLAACNSGSTDTSSGTELLRINYASPPAGFKQEPYTFRLEATTGIQPLQYRISSGELPPGLQLDASSGNISGTPSQSGSFSFVVRVSDARLSSDTKNVSISIQDQPIPTLALEVPATELRGTSKVPLRITGARKVGAARFLWQVPAGITVNSVQGGSARPLLLWRLKEGVLTLDMGFAASPAKDDVVAYLNVTTNKPNRLSGTSGFEVRSLEGKVLNKQALPEPVPVVVPPPGLTPKDPKDPVTPPTTTEPPKDPVTPPTTTEPPKDPQDPVIPPVTPPITTEPPKDPVSPPATPPTSSGGSK